jgi:hypothetical protein
MCFPKLLRCHDFSFLFSWQWPWCSECKAILRINLFKIIFHLKAVFGPDTYPRTQNIGRRTWADYQQSFTDLAVHSSQISHMPDWQPFNASLRTIAIIMARTSNFDQSQLLISHCWRAVPISSNNRSATSSKLSSETGYLSLWWRMTRPHFSLTDYLPLQVCSFHINLHIFIWQCHMALLPYSTNNSWLIFLRCHPELPHGAPICISTVHSRKLPISLQLFGIDPAHGVFYDGSHLLVFANRPVTFMGAFTNADVSLSNR